MSATISIHLFATLKPLEPEIKESYPIETGTKIRDVIHKLNIPEKEAKLIFVNGRKADMHMELHGGERLSVFPPIGGG